MTAYRVVLANDDGDTRQALDYADTAEAVALAAEERFPGWRVLLVVERYRVRVLQGA